MSLNEILAEIPKLSFAERQELVRRAIEVEDNDLTAEEKAVLDRRLEDFRRDPDSGVPAEQLKDEVSRRLNSQ
jgi:putative addiction module component (TIGR02574 family)